ncbi:hypothetical protein [Paludibacterium purpuratum]|uniref:Uncharacterized protein n=1 Tax=Paludibacterium purpuratum TaxID=1144873 RepID=A0A4R7BC25_9NEIS|nr:hypothetical protein [Paludibacterium purpuratum]TDR82213.1 hypothetical protein DFP86_102327 [Paludibacterium purpuratum]
MLKRIICKRPAGYPYEELFRVPPNRDMSLCIIPVDPGKILDFAYQMPGYPNPYRLPHLQTKSFDWLEVPFVEVNASGCVKFIDGRHRPLVLSERGYRSIPYITLQVHAETLLDQVGTDLQILLEEYDLSALSIPLLGATSPSPVPE